MTLIDTGPLVALILVNEPDHPLVEETVRQLRPGSPVTTWSCLTEAMHLLGREAGHRGQAELWSMFLDGTLSLHTHTDSELRRMEMLMREYADAPMDLADASLITIAEVLGVLEVLTLDSHFRAYRLAGGRFLNVFP